MPVGVNGSPPPLVFTLLERAMHQLRGRLYALSEERFPGLRARHYRLLSLLPDEGERVSRLAQDSGLTKQALAQALAPLEAGGYVEVGPDPADRRARVVRLSDRGREVNTAVRALLDGVEQGWATRVGASDYATARRVLTAIAELG